MLTGSTCLGYHCLARWRDKLIADGPPPPLLATPSMLRLARERHAAEIAALEARMARLKAGEP